MDKERKNKKLILILAILAVLVLGFWAGIAGEFFARYYLSNFAFFRDFYFTDTSTGQREIIINEPKKVVVEQDVQLQQIKTDIAYKVAGVFKKKKLSENALNNVFLPQDYLGQAVILTSDGWLISTNDVLVGTKDSLVINYKNKNYDLLKIVPDTASGYVFLKINAQNLPVIKFANLQDVFNGQQIYVYDLYSDQFVLANIKDKKFQIINDKFDFIVSSESLATRILLNKEFAANFHSAPLLNSQGDIIGLLTVTDKVINQALPVNYLNPVINQVLKDEALKRPYLGLNYINISTTFGLPEAQRQNLSTGILIWPDSLGVAIKTTSPLAKILVSGDIILSIEGQKIDAAHELTDLLLEYKSGQEIGLQYLHQGVETAVAVILK